jgi:hypothetical protein
MMTQTPNAERVFRIQEISNAYREIIPRLPSPKRLECEVETVIEVELDESWPDPLED